MVPSFAPKYPQAVCVDAATVTAGVAGTAGAAVAALAAA